MRKSRFSDANGAKNVFPEVNKFWLVKFNWVDRGTANSFMDGLACTLE